MTGCDTVPLAGWQFLRASWQPALEISDASFQPQWTYLRAQQADGRTAWLVLGEREPTLPQATDVWFTAERQVLRLRDGRVVGSAGLPVDTNFTPLDAAPAWRLVAERGSSVYRRQREVTSAYQYGLTEWVQTRKATSPPPGWVSRVPGSPTAHWQWFTEDATVVSIEGQPTPQGERLPTAWFAVDLQGDAATVMASRQCLTPSYCLDLQVRPPRR